MDSGRLSPLLCFKAGGFAFGDLDGAILASEMGLGRRAFGHGWHLLRRLLLDGFRGRLNDHGGLHSALCTLSDTLINFEVVALVG